MNKKTTLILFAWGAAVFLLFGQLVTYSAQQGAAVLPPIYWPEETTLKRQPDRWTILIFVHPKCPCTKAALSEFARLQALHNTSVDTSIALFVPPDQDPRWAYGVITNAASRIKGVDLINDPEAKIAKQFNIYTSGHVLAYRPDGSLAYSGGLTNSRGHEGLSQGTTALLKALKEPQSKHRAEYPVFGCPIVQEEICLERGCEAE